MPYLNYLNPSRSTSHSQTSSIPSVSDDPFFAPVLNNARKVLSPTSSIRGVSGTTPVPRENPFADQNPFDDPSTALAPSSAQQGPSRLSRASSVEVPMTPSQVGFDDSVKSDTEEVLFHRLVWRCDCHRQNVFVT